MPIEYLLKACEIQLRLFVIPERHRLVLYGVNVESRPLITLDYRVEPDNDKKSAKFLFSIAVIS